MSTVVERSSVRGLAVSANRMGYQPSLDGLRAISVVAVILYHAGFEWITGGFYGVEVFFVVSGFLITSLLIEERQATGGVSLRQFWLRRFRRLLPALATVLVVVGVWMALFGSHQQQSDLARDYPWAIFYSANWGQLVADVPYFGNVSPIRHLWSLAVEEQWYLVWPMVFVLVSASRSSAIRRAQIVGGIGVAIMAMAWWLSRSPDVTAGRINFLYLSTFTRASGLLLGAGAAFVWRPWQRRAAARSSRSHNAGAMLDSVGLVAILVLVWTFAIGHVDSRTTYRWQLALVSICSLVAVLVVVHPESRFLRPIMALPPLVAIGQRSYGLYLWSWPISVVLKAYSASWGRFIVAMMITALVSEACYRFIETPIRRGAIGRWLNGNRDQNWSTVALCSTIAAIALVVPLTAKYTQVTPFNAYAGGEDVALDVSGVAPAATPTTSGATQVSPAESSTQPTDATAEGAVSSTTTTAPPPTGPINLVIVGDSQANALAINLPDGTGELFTVANGAVEGCSVQDTGKAVSATQGSVRSFSNCQGWTDEWVGAARQVDADVALVVIGAWDVFDIELDGRTLTFGSAEWDQYYLAGLQRGIDALAGEGVHAALLEVPCMRPVEASGQGQAPLMERGDDARTAHVSAVLQQAAQANPGKATFVSGPAQWCGDEAIATDLGYRWDGVHVYKPGAKLIIEAIASTLLSLPRRQ